MPLHFLNENILAMSTLALHRPKHDTGCIQNRRTLFHISGFLLFLYPPTESRSASQISSDNPPSWSNPDLCHLTLTSPYQAWGVPGELKEDRMPHLSTATNEPEARWLVWLAVMRSVQSKLHSATALCLTDNIELLHVGSCTTPQTCQFRYYFLFLPQVELEWNTGPILPHSMNVKIKTNSSLLDRLALFVWSHPSYKNTSLPRNTPACPRISKALNATDCETSDNSTFTRS